jgi:hypothetical protein
MVPGQRHILLSLLEVYNAITLGFLLVDYPVSL